MSPPRGWVHYNMKNSPTAGREVWDVKRLLEVRRHRRTKKIQPEKLLKLKPF